MADQLKVAWYDGLNVSSVHFEQQERFLQRVIDFKTIEVFSNLYGITTLEFSKEMLIQGKIVITRIEGIAQDGSIFSAPEQDLLPEPLEINYDSLANSVITLKIPLGIATIADIALRNNIPNTKYIALKSAIASRNYDDESNEILRQIGDEYESENIAFTQEKVSVALASLRLKLGILNNAAPDELEIPIAKIKSIDANKKIDLEEEFIPTCLNISKIPIIKSFLEENIHSIKQHKNNLTNIFKGIDQTKNTLDFSTYVSLNLLKKWYLIFSYLINKDKLHPEFLYEKLIEFQGDLGAFNEDDTFLEFIKYNHDNLNETFLPLMNNIRILFSRITSPRYTMARLISGKNGFYDFLFDNPSILQNNEIYLAVNADVNHEYLLQNFKTQSKIHTQSKIKDIVATQLRGLNLEQISNIPNAIPYLSGYIYYRFDKKDEVFADFKGENIVSIYITNNIKSPDIKIWAVF
ncbi:type VI secretion system baseplate subunit TssK [uncultured Helicobacter sp.]|uniref:type VI secretion system baseplate subunit TssK n=1 Tax=uncultured Helicobacter sp. TaxID=175537 RepID=UPI00261E9EFB|nr:type VI secretion system baseplate subunit TssK [uncultured Helicobacter sp.]